MYFPVSGVEVSPFVPPLIALGVSFFASMGGISGAFLLLPFQMSVLGYTNPSVSGTNHFYNIVAIPSGVYRYVKEKRMVWPLTAIIAAGTLPGVVLGTYFRVAWLPDARDFKLFAACVLFYIGGKLVVDLVRGMGKAPAKQAAPPAAGQPENAAFSFVRVEAFNLKELAYSYQGETFRCSTPAIFLLSVIIGLIGGAYGIGGGAIMAPFLVSWFRLPIHTLGGATLMGTFLTSIAGVTFFMIIAPYFPQHAVTPDWSLGLLFGAGGFAGMYFGARCQKYVRAIYIKWMLGVVIISTALKYVVEYVR